MPDVPASLTSTRARMVAQSFKSPEGFVIYVTFPGALKPKVILGAPQLSDTTTLFSGVVLEMVGTFLLTWVVLVNHGRALAGVSVGFAMTALQLFVYPFTGACFNPVRAAACLLCAWTINVGNVAHLLGPLIGAFVAVHVYRQAYNPLPPLGSKKKQRGGTASA